MGVGRRGWHRSDWRTSSQQPQLQLHQVWPILEPAPPATSIVSRAVLDHTILCSSVVVVRIASCRSLSSSCKGSCAGIKLTRQQLSPEVPGVEHGRLGRRRPGTLPPAAHLQHISPIHPSPPLSIASFWLYCDACCVGEPGQSSRRCFTFQSAHSHLAYVLARAPLVHHCGHLCICTLHTSAFLSFGVQRRCWSSPVCLFAALPSVPLLRCSLRLPDSSAIPFSLPRLPRPRLHAWLPLQGKLRLFVCLCLLFACCLVIRVCLLLLPLQLHPQSHSFLSRCLLDTGEVYLALMGLELMVGWNSWWAGCSS